MKKVFGQTVRDLKREVNKKVLKVPGVEQKVLDATSNEAWGPHGALLADLAKASLNFHEHQMIMNVIWKRINDTGKNWRHVYKALTVLEYLVAHGSERVIDEIREHAYQISTLSTFQYVDSSGRDQGSQIRRKSQNLVALVNDKERVLEVRQKANGNREKYQSSGKPSHGDRYDDKRNSYDRERENVHGNDDRNSRGREERYGRDHEDQNGRDGYRNDDYGGRGTDGERGSIDRYTDRSGDDDDRYSSKSGGGRGDGHTPDDRRLEQQFSEENVGAPPSYEEVTKNAQNHTMTERDGEHVGSPRDTPTHAAPNPDSSTGITSPNLTASSESPATLNMEADAFDEFDPRGFVPATMPPGPTPSTQELDFFGGFSASDTTGSSATTVHPDFGMNFTSSTEFNISSETNENPFGDPPFKAISDDSYQAQPQNSTPFHSTQVTNGIAGPFSSNMGTVPGYDFGDMLGGLNYTPEAEMPGVADCSDILDGILPRTDSASNISSQTTQHVAPKDSPFDEPGLPAMFPSQEHPNSSQAAQPAGPNDVQPPQLNFFQEDVPFSASLPSQNAQVSSQAAQPPMPDNMQSAYSNFPQQSASIPASMPLQTAPFSSEAAQPPIQNNMQSAHLNFPQQAASVPTSLPPQSAPFSSQAAQPPMPDNMQSAYSNFPQQVTSITASRPPQTAPFSSQAAQPPTQNNTQYPQQAASVPASLPPQSAPFPSQAAQPANMNNMQLDHLNFLPQGVSPSPLPSQEAPILSQASQPAASNTQSSQFDFFQQPESTSVSFPPSATQGSLTAAQPGTPNNMQLELYNNFQQPSFSGSVPYSSQVPQPAAPGNTQPTQLNPLHQGVPPPSLPQAAPTSFAPPAKAQPVKFEPKSTVWADTLNRGLVDLNISGPKTNPLSDIGIDFDSINRKEKRKEAKSSAAPVTSTITMGKAMGTGSGIGRSGAISVSSAQSPMAASGMAMGRGGHMGAGGGMGMGGGPNMAMGVGPNGMGMNGGANMGMGMNGGANMGMGGGMGMGGYGNGMYQPSMGMNMGGYGGGMNQQPSMGGVNMGMGMTMGMNPGAQMQPPNGMPPPAPGMYNPMMGMNNYSSQQQNGGAPQQQPFGGGYR